MEEKIYFKSSKGYKLCGILSNQKKDKKDKYNSIIIICHGFGRNKNSKTPLGIRNALENNKITTFRFDFFGHGESDGKFENITISEAVDDVLSAIKFLRRKGYNKIGFAGSSFGGIAGLMAASKTRDLSILALKSPVSNYKDKEYGTKQKKELKEWKTKGYIYYACGNGNKLKLNYSFFEDFKNNNGYEAARKIKIPTIIVHGDKDETVPVKQSKKTAYIIKGCTLKIIKGANHTYSKPEHFQKMINYISAFIVKNK